MTWRHPLLTTPFICLISCATHITPPVNPREPVSVFLIDYGRHSSLVLPDPIESDHLIKYTYGDWNWFALDQSQWYDVFPTLLWPTCGALGRRVLNTGPEEVRRIAAEQVLEIVVSLNDAIDLSARLESQFKQYRDNPHYQPLYGLYFVHSDRPFHVFNNCNHVVVDWLRELGCNIEGPAMLADFVLKKPTARTN